MNVGLETRILVVGAGVSGSIAAKTLQDEGLNVTVVDKGRGAGGRLSSRRTELGRFNHGAPDFEVTSPCFERFVKRCCAAGILERTIHFNGARYHAPSAMNAVVKHLQRGLDVQFNTRVLRISRENERWVAETDQGTQGDFHYVVIAIPGPQAVSLIPKSSLMHDRTDKIGYLPAWVVMLSSGESEALLPDGDLISRITHNEGGVCVYLTAEASTMHLESSPEDITRMVCERLDEKPQYAAAHRWRYSQVVRSLDQRYLTDDALGLSVCGDGFGGAGVEAAFLSGLTAAQRLIESLSSQSPSAT